MQDKYLALFQEPEFFSMLGGYVVLHKGDTTKVLTWA